MSMTTVQYQGKRKQCEPVCNNVCKREGRDGDTYLVKCSVTGEWYYCSKERMEKKIEQCGSIEAVGREYVSRGGRKRIEERRSI